MKRTIAMLTFAVAASLAIVPANAAGAGSGITSASQGFDLSSAKKKKKVQSFVHVYPSHYGYYPRSYYYPQAFAPGDPSWQSPELIRRRAIGECVIDLGYGRYESCDSAGRGGR
jgi:hypothetical protein